MQATQFKVVTHTVPPRVGIEVVEVWLEGAMVATIYPSDHQGIRILSAHVASIGSHVMGPVKALLMEFEVPNES